jgi:hypothetical protein
MAQKVGTLAALLDAQMGIRVRQSENPLISAAGAADLVFLSLNPSRVGFSITNLDAGVSVAIRANGIASAAAGIIVQPGNSFVSDWRVDFDSVGYEWHVIALGAGANLYVRELVIVPT